MYKKKSSRALFIGFRLGSGVGWAGARVAPSRFCPSTQLWLCAQSSCPGGEACPALLQCFAQVPPNQQVDDGDARALDGRCNWCSSAPWCCRGEGQWRTAVLQGLAQLWIVPTAVVRLVAALAGGLAVVAVVDRRWREILRRLHPTGSC